MCLFCERNYNGLVVILKKIRILLTSWTNCGKVLFRNNMADTCKQCCLVQVSVFKANTRKGQICKHLSDFYVVSLIVGRKEENILSAYYMRSTIFYHRESEFEVQIWLQCSFHKTILLPLIKKTLILLMSCDFWAKRITKELAFCCFQSTVKIGFDIFRISKNLRMWM